MRPELYSADKIAALLRRRKIATMREIKAALGTPVERTAFRKLSELHYRTSYSHRGRFYTLDEVPRFDRSGLWSCRSVWFSAHGSLVDTAAALVDASPAGYLVDEFDTLLHVKTKDCLRHLVACARLAREDFQGRNLFCSPDAGRRRAQIAARRMRTAEADALRGARPPTEELKATIILFLGLLDERQRRLFAGLESMKLGRGGDLLVARLLGLDPATVAKGRCELTDHRPATGRLRRAGGGRKAAEKKRRKSSAGSPNSSGTRPPAIR